MKLSQMNTALVAALIPLCRTVAEGSGKLWEATRDAFVKANAAYGDPADAASAVRTVIVESLKANPGSAKGYLSTLTWLRKAGHDVATLSNAQAVALRYPAKEKLAPIGTEKGIQQREALLAEAKAEVAKKAEAEAAADAADPRRALLRELSRIAGGLSFPALSELVALAGEVTDAQEAPTEGGEKEAANG